MRRRGWITAIKSVVLVWSLVFLGWGGQGWRAVFGKARGFLIRDEQLLCLRERMAVG